MSTKTKPQNGQRNVVVEEPDDFLSELENVRPAEYQQSQETASLNCQVSTAKRYPRSIRRFLDDATSMATIDQETAETCFYSLPRQGKSIEGPSVRLAEICASAWGNLVIQSRITDLGERFAVAEAEAWDLERNVRMKAEIRRRITDKRGKRFGDDMIAVTANAAASIALRNAIFRVIPRAHVDTILRQARKVAVGDAKTLASRRVEMLAYFGKMGVHEPRLLAAMGCKGIEDIDLDKLATLKGFATAIKDGAASIDECFPEEGADVSPQTLADKVRGSEPLASETLLDEINAGLQAAGASSAWINQQLSKYGVDSASKLTESKARLFLAEVAKLPPAEGGGDDE